MTPELIYQLLTALVLAGATYGGIRADIKAIHERLKDVKETSDEAHQRIDKLLLDRGYK